MQILKAAQLTIFLFGNQQTLIFASVKPIWHILHTPLYHRLHNDVIFTLESCQLKNFKIY